MTWTELSISAIHCPKRIVSFLLSHYVCDFCSSPLEFLKAFIHSFIFHWAHMECLFARLWALCLILSLSCNSRPSLISGVFSRVCIMYFSFFAMMIVIRTVHIPKMELDHDFWFHFFLKQALIKQVISMSFLTLNLPWPSLCLWRSMRWKYSIKHLPHFEEVSIDYSHSMSLLMYIASAGYAASMKDLGSRTTQ